MKDDRADSGGAQTFKSTDTDPGDVTKGTPLRAAVMFSGGGDSSLASGILSRLLDEVHLVTYETDVDIFVKFSEKSSDALKKAFPGKVRHSIMPIPPWWMDNQVRHWDCLHFACITCKFIMHVRTVIYCLENAIPLAADGAIQEEVHNPEQMPGVLDTLKRFYGEFGIRHIHPSYFYTVGKEDAALGELGIDMGNRVRAPGLKGYHIHRQPYCVLANVVGVFLSNPYSDNLIHEEVVRHLESDLEYGRSIIRTYFEEKGEDLDALIERVREQPIPPEDVLESMDHRRELSVEEQTAKTIRQRYDEAGASNRAIGDIVRFSMLSSMFVEGLVYFSAASLWNKQLRRLTGAIYRYLGLRAKQAVGLGGGARGGKDV